MGGKLEGLHRRTKLPSPESLQKGVIQNRLNELLNIPIEWQFWTYSIRYDSVLEKGVFDHSASLTMIGQILGSFVVTLLDKRSRLHSQPKWYLSVGGGLLMGMGAVMALGCNIGAYFGGVASGSAHGWLWLVFALIGDWVGLKVMKANP